MTTKELKILDKEIQYLSEYKDRLQVIRQATGINPKFCFLREAETIESLYKSVLEDRKKIKSSYFFASTSGWTVQYIRDKKTYKKGEKFKVMIFHSFVYTDNYE